MKRAVAFFCLWIAAAYGFETDFDTVIVGASPITMFEAIYRAKIGERVLVVESAAECGGAWKSIEVCGVPNVDLGCHEFGANKLVEQFLEEYAGCKMIPNAPKRVGGCPGKVDWGVYPLRGCYELTKNLELRMRKAGVALLLKTRLESVYVDNERHIAEVQISGARYRTKKIVVTAYSEVKLENLPEQSPCHRSKYPHLYMLISDPTPTRFTYYQPCIDGVTRLMNVTQFTGLDGTGLQLISLQMRNELALKNGNKCFQELKRLSLVDPSAELVRMESYVFEQGSFDRTVLNKVGGAANTIFEILDTNHIINMGKYLEKWKGVIEPWKTVELAAES